MSPRVEKRLIGGRWYTIYYDRGGIAAMVPSNGSVQSDITSLRNTVAMK